MLARFTWRPLLATIALLVPFCTCHFVLLLETGDGCCGDGRAGIGAVRRVTSMAAPETVRPEAASRESTCGSTCCRRDATQKLDDASRDLAQRDAHRDSPSGPPDDAPSEPSAPPAPLPGCGSDTCCVKSVPQEAPWQLPPALLVTIVDLEAIVPHSLARLLAIEWPPTLPLGQPPTLFDRGTLLLV